MGAAADELGLMPLLWPARLAAIVIQLGLQGGYFEPVDGHRVVVEAFG